MARIFAALVVGLIFGTGISISGMINPTKVLNFFDLAGNWDPSLAFVMAGALIVVMIGYRFVLKRAAPLLFQPTKPSSTQRHCFDRWGVRIASQFCACFSTEKEPSLKFVTPSAHAKVWYRST